MFFIKKIKYVNLNKIYNFIKLYYSYIFKHINHNNYPVSISVEPTTSCNLQCPECPSGLRKFTRNTGNLENESLIEILNQLGDYLFNITYYFQGEPFLNKKLFEHIRLINSRKIFTVVSTNGHFLNENNCEKIIESKLDRLIISYDGLDQESYSSYRIGGYLNKVEEGIKLLSKIKKLKKSSTPEIVLQFLVTSMNESQIKLLKQKKKELGANKIELKTAQFYDYENGNILMPKNNKYSRYKLDSNGKYKIKSKLKNKCWKSWHSCVVTWDGDVVPCCFDKDAKYVFGNILNAPFKQILKNEKYKDFQKNILADRKSIDICSNCTDGLF